MIKALADFFDRAFSPRAAPEDREHALRVATALLLIEVARADYETDFVEDAAILAQIEQFFGLDETSARLVVAEASRQADHSASLHSFTRRLVEALSPVEREHVVEMLWSVALADRRLDKHEDYVVRQVAELLYVSQSALIRIRNRTYEPRL
jgi:uncharacterized tellurite resistance protein B-like protein